MAASSAEKIHASNYLIMKIRIPLLEMWGLLLSLITILKNCWNWQVSESRNGKPKIRSLVFGIAFPPFGSNKRSLPLNG